MTRRGTGLASGPRREMMSPGPTSHAPRRRTRRGGAERLAAAGELRTKVYGKAAIYYPNQTAGEAALDVMETEDVLALVAQKDALKVLPCNVM